MDQQTLKAGQQIKEVFVSQPMRTRCGMETHISVGAGVHKIEVVGIPALHCDVYCFKCTDYNGNELLTINSLHALAWVPDNKPTTEEPTSSELEQ